MEDINQQLATLFFSPIYRMHHCFICHRTEGIEKVHECNFDIVASSCRPHCPLWTREVNPFGKHKKITDVKFKLNDDEQLVEQREEVLDI